MTKETIKLLMISGLLTFDDGQARLDAIDATNKLYELSYEVKTINVETTSDGINRIVRDNFSFL